MKNITISLLTIIFSVSIGYSQKADDITGKYHLPNKLDIEIFKYKTTYAGRIIALNGFENGQTKDIKNPDGKKRNDPLTGKVIITGLKFNPETKTWENGKMYGAEKGMFFNLRIKKLKKDKITVEASKYFFKKTIDWERI
ncbi:MAG: DUF2147 domain-containing protein [Chlorobi bacterium]|nr:DUF2147 domain-containing protein [Chlorobiota bacterium]